jgi:hypothetical protein
MVQLGLRPTRWRPERLFQFLSRNVIDRGTRMSAQLWRATVMFPLFRKIGAPVRRFDNIAAAQG